MRQHWRDPDVRRRRHAAVRLQRERRHLEARIARLESGIAGWEDHDPADLQRVEPLLGFSPAQHVAEMREELHALRVRAKILDQLLEEDTVTKREPES